MIAAESSLDVKAIAALLVGEPLPWTSLRVTPPQFLQACEGERLTGLVSQRVGTLGDASWPHDVRDSLAESLRAHTATELLRQRELISVLDALASHNIRPVIMKGTALAYSVYGAPASRPRADTDLLIPRHQVEPAQRVLAGIGYVAPVQCDGELLFGQFSRKRVDEFGLVHALDVHWRLSTQSLFAGVLCYDEVAAVARPVPALGPHARIAGPAHALVLACIHPVMHHGNATPLIWQYDIHLLAATLSAGDWEAFAKLAVDRRVSIICARQLEASRNVFGTRVPAVAMAALEGNRDERSAEYLRPGRRWKDDMLANLRGLTRWRDRLRLLREVLLPAPAYMAQSYGVRSSSLGRALLPVLYGHRLASGLFKVLAGRS